MGFDGFKFVEAERRGRTAVSFAEGLLCVLVFMGTTLLYQMFADPGLFASGMESALYAPPLPPSGAAPGPRILDIVSTHSAKSSSTAPPMPTTEFYAPLEVPRTIRVFVDGAAAVGDGNEGVISGGGGNCLSCGLIGVEDGQPTHTVFVPPPPPPPARPPTTIAPPPPSPPAPQPPAAQVRLGGNVAEGYLIDRIQPEYPRLAIVARVEGSVVLSAVIGKQGRIEKLSVVSGNTLLIRAATDAVSQWKYRPYMLNGEVTEVVTTITVNFSLSR